MNGDLELSGAELLAEHTGHHYFLDASASSEPARTARPRPGSFDGAADASTALPHPADADNSACATGDAGNGSRPISQQTTTAGPHSREAGPTVADERSIS